MPFCKQGSLIKIRIKLCINHVLTVQIRRQATAEVVPGLWITNCHHYINILNNLKRTFKFSNERIYGNKYATFLGFIGKIDQNTTIGNNF